MFNKHQFRFVKKTELTKDRLKFNKKNFFLEVKKFPPSLQGSIEMYLYLKIAYKLSKFLVFAGKISSKKSERNAPKSALIAIILPSRPPLVAAQICQPIYSIQTAVETLKPDFQADVYLLRVYTTFCLFSRSVLFMDNLKMLEKTKSYVKINGPIFSINKNKSYYPLVLPLIYWFIPLEKTAKFYVQMVNSVFF